MPGETAGEPSGDSTQAAAPASTEWSPKGGGDSSGGAAPLEHGSSVGSGVVTEKAGSDSEAPSYTPDESGSYEPEPSTPSTFEEPASTPQVESVAPSVQPEATPTPAARANRAADVAVDAGTSVDRSAQPQGGDIDSTPPGAVASFTDSGDGASTSSYALPILTIIVLGLVLGFAGVRLRRRRRRRGLETLWRQQDAAWEAALLRAELGQASGASEPSAQTLQRIGVG